LIVKRILSLCGRIGLSRVLQRAGIDVRPRFSIAFTLPPVPVDFWQSRQWHARSSVIGTLTV